MQSRIETQLFSAIQKNDEKQVRSTLAEMKEFNEVLEQTESIKTITKPASIEAKDEKGFTPLIQAAKEGHMVIVKALLENGALVDNPANNGSTPLMCAAQNGHKDCLELLIKAKANLNAKGLWDRTPLMWAAATGQFDCLAVLLEHKVELNNRDTDGCTALILASKIAANCVAALLKAGADLTVKDNKELTAAEHAFRMKHLSCHEMLTDSNYFNKPEKKLFLAVTLNDIPLLKEAITQINQVNDEIKKNPSLVGKIEPLSINARNKYNRTPLISAVIKNQVECLKLLIDNKADLNINEDGTALVWAAYMKHDDCTKLLSESDGIDLNAKDKSKTALHYTVLRDSESGIRALLEQKGIDVNAKDEEGVTALTVASINGFKSAIKALLEQKGIDVNSKDNVGNTALMWAVDEGYESCTKLLLDEAKGIDLDIQDNLKRTALHHAAEKGNTKLCELLIAHGANANIKDIFNRTADEWGCSKIITAALKKRKAEHDPLPENARQETITSRLSSMYHSLFSSQHTYTPVPENDELELSSSTQRRRPGHYKD